MFTLYYEPDSFTDSKDAWSNAEAHWAEHNPQAGRRLNWEGVKSEYAGAFYRNGRWHLLREVIDYTERKPTLLAAREDIGACPVCRKPALVQQGDFVVKEFYVHRMGVKDTGKMVPVRQHFAKHDRGRVIDASDI